MRGKSVSYSLILIILIVVILVLVILNYTTFQIDLGQKKINGNLTEPSTGDEPSSPIRVDISLSNAPALNQTAMITVTLYSPRYRDNVSSRIFLSEGISFLEGDMSWEGFLYENSTIKFNATVKIIKTGDFDITARAFIENEGAGRDILYLRILENETFVSKAHFPLAVTNDSMTRLNPEDIPQINISPTNISEPEPSYFNYTRDAQAPSSPLKIDMSISSEPKFNQDVLITTRISSVINTENITVKFVLPEGFTFVDGISTWEGNLNKGDIITFTSTIKPVRYGKWEIVAIAKGKNGIGAKDNLYFLISGNTSEVRKSRFPLSPNETSDKMTKLLPSEIPDIKIIVDKSITQPTPTMPSEFVNDDIIPAKKEPILNSLSFDGNRNKQSKPLVKVSLSPGSVVVKANFYYKDRNNITQPLRWATAEVWDDDTITGDDHLGTNITGVDGSFQLGPIDNIDGEGGTQDIYLRVLASSNVANVTGSSSDDIIYDGYTSTTWDVPDGTYNAGNWLTPTSDDEKPAWWVYENLLDGWNYVKNSATPSFDMPKQEAYWNYTNTTGSYYIHDGKIQLKAGHANDSDVILHEYGHAVMYRVYGNWMPDTPNCSPHSIDLIASTGCAWVEGWAEFYPLAVFNDKIYNDSTNGFYVNFESRTPYDPWDGGDQVEGNVAASLWDIFDSMNDGNDTFSDGFNNIWNTVYNYNDDNFSAFYNSWGTYEKTKLTSALSQNTIYYNNNGISCSSASQCSTGYCQGSTTYSARCCSSAPPNDGWYGGGNTYVPNCGSVDNDASSYYRDYYCDSSGNAQYENTNSIDCDWQDGWYGGDDTSGCGSDPNSYWLDYYAFPNNSYCDHSSVCYGTQSFNCDSSDSCSPYCDGNTRYFYKDYYVVANTNTCTYNAPSEDCTTKPSDDSDGGNSPTTYGYCLDYTGCSAGSCIGMQFNDSCISSTSLNETYASGTACANQIYSCSDFEIAASDSHGNDPNYTDTCTAGTGAGCSGGAFSTTAGSGGTDYCAGTCGTGTNSCYFVEYYPIDSGDACPGLDTCGTQNYDADTNQNTCDTCKGTNYWNIGGEINSTVCCGDDANENKITRQCDTGICETNSSDDACCLSSNKCVYNNVCYSNGYYGDIDSDALNEVCSSGIWKAPPKPQINWMSTIPNPQGFGRIIQIKANITDIVSIDKVLVGIAAPNENETNYTMTNVSQEIYQYNFTDFSNGTYSYRVYANNTIGEKNQSSVSTFVMFVELYANIKTMKDYYERNEKVNITDPPDIVDRPTKNGVV